jgi:hypothetical protein
MKHNYVQKLLNTKEQINLKLMQKNLEIQKLLNTKE